MTVLDDVRAELETRRGAGESFDAAWRHALRCVANAPDADGWAAALADTKLGWRAAYERRPATRAELALVVFLQDAERVPLEAADLLPRDGVVDPSEAGRAIRELANISQQAFAAVVGVSLTTLSRWERGERRPAGAVADRYAEQVRSLVSATARA